MRPVVALYKAYSGGEWFGLSLSLVAPHVDGIAVVFTRRPWLPALQLGGNCRDVLDAYRREWPAKDVATVEGDWVRQEPQYERGLELVREHWGAGATVMLVDTDELWEPGQAAYLAGLLRESEPHRLYRSGILTYLRSPAYQVYPMEHARTVVGLSSTDERCTRGRFQNLTTARPMLEMSDVAFHHYPYVREDEGALWQKLLNTGSQEGHPNDSCWMERVYWNLPRGADLHTTMGHGHVWACVRVVPTPMLWEGVRGDPFVLRCVRRAEDAWRDMLLSDSPEETLVPVPGKLDAERYGSLWRRWASGAKYDELCGVLKCTVLEGLWLAAWASQVPSEGHILEIGSGSGGSMGSLALGAPAKASFTSVDPFLPYDEENNRGVSRGVMEGDQGMFERTAARFKFAERVRRIKRKSADAAEWVANGSCDMVFVDGNHSRANVEEDLRLYWPKLKPGGLLVGHDYTRRFPGVIAAVAGWSGPAMHVAGGTSLFYARKPL